MYCPDCGRRNEAQARFCSECGTAFASGPAPAHAPVLEPHELVHRASELKDTGQLEAAIELCRRAILAEPRHRGAHALLGLLYEKKGQTNSAIREYRVVLEIDPNSTAEREKLAMLLGGEVGAPSTMPERRWRWVRQPWHLPALGAAVLLIAVALVSLAVATRQRPEPASGAEVTLAPQGYAPTGAQPGTTGPYAVRPARPVYPVRPGGASPFAGVRPAQPSLAPALPSPVRSTPTFRPRTSRPTPTAGAPAPRSLNAYEGRIPPLVLGSAAEASEPGRSVVTPMREGPLDVRPARPAPETRPSPIEPVRETAEAPTAHIEIWPSVGVRARGGGTAVRPAEAAPEVRTDSSSGRTYQLTAGQLRLQGRHPEAIKQYESAIAAYTKSIQQGSGGAQAAQGIESCKRAIAACKAAQGQT